jgi:hypothetical protein
MTTRLRAGRPRNLGSIPSRAMTLISGLSSISALGPTQAFRIPDVLEKYTKLLRINRYNKGKAIPVTDRGGLQGCETSRLPQFLDSRLTDGGEIVSLTCRPPFIPPEDSWYSFLLGAESTSGP